MNDPYEKSHWHDPKQHRNTYGPSGRRLTPYDHKGFMDEMSSPHFHEVTLHKKRMEFQTEVDRRTQETMGRISRTFVEDRLTGNIIHRFRMDVWGEEDRTTAIAKVPATWEDAFKLGLITVFDNPLINWFVKRSPIRYKEVKASLKVHYPDFKPSLPDHDYVCKVAISDPFHP